MRVGATSQDYTHLADWALAEVGFQNANPAPLVREGDVDELIQTARSQDGGVDDVRSVCGSDDEDVLLAGHSIHLGQDLVDDTVGCSASISNVAATGLSYGVKLIKEQNAWSCLTSLETFTPTCILENNADVNYPHAVALVTLIAEALIHQEHSCLVKDLSDVGFRLSEPHGEQLRSFDRDEICLALIGNGFGQQSLTTTWGAVEQHTLGGGHAKLEELVWVLHWVLKSSRGDKYSKRLYSHNSFCHDFTLQRAQPVAHLHQLLQLPLDIVQSTDVLPGDVGNLNNRLPQCRWVALAQCPL